MAVYLTNTQHCSLKHIWRNQRCSFVLKSLQWCEGVVGRCQGSAMQLLWPLENHYCRVFANWILHLSYFFVNDFTRGCCNGHDRHVFLGWDQSLSASKAINTCWYVVQYFRWQSSGTSLITSALWKTQATQMRSPAVRDQCIRICNVHGCIHFTAKYICFVVNY